MIKNKIFSHPGIGANIFNPMTNIYKNPHLTSYSLVTVTTSMQRVAQVSWPKWETRERWKVQTGKIEAKLCVFVGTNIVYKENPSTATTLISVARLRNVSSTQESIYFLHVISHQLGSGIKHATHQHQNQKIFKNKFHKCHVRSLLSKL